jgi:site-specific recombinase XerC
MLKSDKLSSSAARLRKRKVKIEKTAERIATITVTVRPVQENHQPLSALWILSKDSVDTRSLQHYLGHKNIQHTVRYTELSPVHGELVNHAAIGI